MNKIILIEGTCNTLTNQFLYQQNLFRLCAIMETAFKVLGSLIELSDQ